MKKKFRKGDVVIINMEWYHLLGIVFCYCNHLNVYLIEYHQEEEDCILVYGFDAKVLTKIEGRL